MIKMRLTSSLFLLFSISPSTGFNLAIDTHVRVLDKLFKTLPNAFQTNLDNSNLQDIHDNRRLGRIDMDAMTLHDVFIENTKVYTVNSRAGLAYQLKIIHLKADLDGTFRQKVIFLNQEGNFRVQINDLNATLGPFTLRNVNGLPYIDPSFVCLIHHDLSKVKIVAGKKKLLNKMAEYRVKDVVNKEKMDELLCEKFSNILENFLREMHGLLRLRPKLVTGARMLYDLEFDPKLLDRRQSEDEISSTKGSLRTFHWGVSANVTPPFTMNLTKKINNADFTFHIHEQLLAEAVSVLCQDGLIEKEFSTPSISTLKLSCNGVPRVNVSENQETNKIRVIIPLKAELYEQNETQTFEYEKDLFTRLMYQQNFGKFIFYLQVLSEKLSGDEGRMRFHYGRQIYLHLVEMFKKYVTLPLPTFTGANFFVVGLSSHEDRLEFAVNLE